MGHCHPLWGDSDHCSGTCLFKRRRQTSEGAEPLQLGTLEEWGHPQKPQGVWHGGLARRQGKSCRTPSGSELPSPCSPEFLKLLICGAAGSDPEAQGFDPLEGTQTPCTFGKRLGLSSVASASKPPPKRIRARGRARAGSLGPVAQQLFPGLFWSSLSIPGYLDPNSPQPGGSVRTCGSLLRKVS